ncbi:MAG: cysteine synthase A [Marvinbryantia sp.]|jgi:cysteine synthase A
MENIYTSAMELIGNTPLAEAVKLEEKLQIPAKLLLKLEYLNPAGSVKDRAAKYMIEEAEACGKLKEGATIIEPTSGNTGIGLAMIAAIRGYRIILTMPETMSVERRNILKAYGAEIVLTDGARGMAGAIEKAEELAKEIPGSFVPGQFENPDNAKAHRKTTGPEIWRDTDGKVDVFVSAVGTGGTITGTGEYLKSRNPQIKIVAVEPDSSAVLSGKEKGAHKIQGIGAGFIPQVLNTEIYDEIIRVKDEDAFAAAKMLGRTEGFLTGISSGAALHAAITVAKRPENKGKTVVVLLPDSGDRYYSTPLYMEQS